MALLRQDLAEYTIMGAARLVPAFRISGLVGAFPLSHRVAHTGPAGSSKVPAWGATKVLSICSHSLATLRAYLGRIARH